MNLNISREWLLRMAAKEANGILSVGGFFYREELPMPSPTTYPAAVRPIVEAPDDIAVLFTRWLAEGRPWALTAELTRALQEHRGSRLLTAHDVIWLTKCSDKRDDVIVVMGRSSPLRIREERTR